MTFDVEKDGFRIAQCRICHREIVWAVNEGTGGKIPLDPVAPTFVAKLKQEGKVTVGARKVDHTKDGARVLVSHFSTCPTMMNVGKFAREVKRMIREGKKVTDEEFARRTREYYREYCT